MSVLKLFFSEPVADDATTVADPGSSSAGDDGPLAKRQKISKVGLNIQLESTRYHVELSPEDQGTAENELEVALEAGVLSTFETYEKTRALQRLDFENLGTVELLAKYPWLKDVSTYLYF